MTPLFENGFTCKRGRWGGGGVGGGWVGFYSRFQVTGMIEWGRKSKPEKISGASNKTPQNPWIKD